MKYILLFLILITFGSCKSLVQVMETKTTNTELIDDEYVYENDSIKITYNFWRENGSLKFTVYNKLDKPLYIDWTQSSYINNTEKRNYWVDEENSVSDGYSLYGYNGLGFRKSKTKIQTKSVKPEKVTFIPPKSNFVKNQFVLMPINEFRMNNAEKKKVQSKLRKGKTIDIKVVNYNKSNSPLIFRNFLTLSFSEDFQTKFYVDNEFYLTKVLELDTNHFTTYKKDPDRKNLYARDEFGNRIIISPYYGGDSFYIKLKVK
jgi:hypothetical protein